MKSSTLFFLLAGVLLLPGGCKRKNAPRKQPASKPVTTARPEPMDWTRPRPAIRRPTPPVTEDAGAPRPSGKAPRWTWLPSNKFLCTRFGPEWKVVPNNKKARPTYSQPFVLTHPKGKLLRFSIHAKGRDTTGVTYSAKGLPAGATLDSSKGRFRWRVSGKPGDQQKIELRATSGKGAVTSWGLVLGVAEEELAAAWSAGLGNEDADCEDQFENLELSWQDLNGDGHKDVVWTYIPMEDGHGVDAYNHAVHLWDGSPHYAELEGLELMGSRSKLNVVCAPGGAKLLQLVDTCCAPEIHTFYRVVKHKAVEAGNVEVDDTLSGKQHIRLSKDAQGCIDKITKTVNGRKTVYRWKNGRYRP